MKDSKELTWKTSGGKLPTLAEINKAARKEFPRVPLSRLEVVASGFEGPDTFYRAIHVRPKSSRSSK